MDGNPNFLIKQALSYAADEINHGSDPTKALKKTAEYFDLNYDYTQRVGEALNTALHYNHFKTASDLGATFPLADIQKVNNELYNENEKTANHFKSEHFPNSELFNPIPDLDKIYNRVKYKETYLKIATVPKDEKVKLSAEAIYHKSASYIDQLEKQAIDAKIKQIEVKNNFESSFCSLKDHFKKDAGYRTSFDEFESQAYSKYGESVVPYLDVIYKHANLKEERGIHDKGYIMFEPCKELGKLDKFFKYAEEMKIANQELEDADYNLNFEKQALEDLYRKKESIDKEAGFLDSVINTIKDHSKNEAKKPTPIAHNKELDDFERQAILQDLILRDPVLAKSDHNEVIAAYEQIARIAPNVAKEKEVVKSILRTMVAGQSLGPHSSNMITEADLNLMKQRFASILGTMNTGKQ